MITKMLELVKATRNIIILWGVFIATLAYFGLTTDMLYYALFHYQEQLIVVTVVVVVNMSIYLLLKKDVKALRYETQDFADEMRIDNIKSKIANMYFRYESKGAMTCVKDRAEFLELAKQVGERKINSYTSDRLNTLQVRYDKGTRK